MKLINDKAPPCVWRRLLPAGEKTRIVSATSECVFFITTCSSRVAISRTCSSTFSSRSPQEKDCNRNCIWFSRFLAFLSAITYFSPYGKDVCRLREKNSDGSIKVYLQMRKRTMVS